jgi:hypothetical protein
MILSLVNVDHNHSLLLSDECNDQGKINVFFILARIYDNDLGETVTRFIDIQIVNIGTGENLFNFLDKTLSKREIPWINVLGFMSDNYSVINEKKPICPLQK